MDHLPDFIEFLFKPTSYPHKVEDVTLVQTHISFVLLAGDFVYKFKKPLDFGFLNFIDLEKRKHFCEQEVLLNKRLCPTIYLGLATITLQSDGTFMLDGPGEPVEYGVKMVRMPQDRMMGHIIRAGKLTRQMIDDIVSILIPFYESAAKGAGIEKYATTEAVWETIFENLEQCRPYIGSKPLNQEEFDKIGSYVRNFLKRESLFLRRIAAGKICDCHGDLHSANICLADKVYIYDCIEFNHRFRYIDIANDVAFLAMDLDYYGLEDLSEYFISTFQKASGDEELSEVLSFYKCYRAAVRGKIGLLTGHEMEVDEETRISALKQATRYFVLAQKYADNE